MSSPSRVNAHNASVGVRDGTRVILREITANLQNSSPGTSPRRKTGNEASSSKADNQQQQQQHDVKVRFIREFADATDTTVRDGIPESSSLSSASSFQSLASTLSSKCSSGICVDSSPSKNADNSYLTSDIPGLDDLISACEQINLDETSKEQSFELRVDSGDNTPDETFRSATDQASLDRTRENSPINFPNETDDNLNATTDIVRGLSPDDINRNLNVTTDIANEISPPDSSNSNDFNLNVTTEIRKGNSPTNSPNASLKADNNLNVTTEISKEASPINHQNPTDSQDLNITREITNDNSHTSHGDRANPDLNVTKDLTSDDSTTHPSDRASLDATRLVTHEYTASEIDLDATREVTRETSSPNSEVDEFQRNRIFDEGEKQSLSFGPSGNSNETFVRPVNDIDKDIELAKTDESSTVSPLTESRSDEGLKGCDERPLELITPSISQFKEKLIPPTIEDRADVTDVSPVKNISIFNDEEFKIPGKFDKFHDGTKSLINESKENSQCPTLPSLSSIRLPSDVTEETNLLEAPIRSTDISEINSSENSSGSKKNDEIEEGTSTAALSISDKFIAIAERDNRPDNSLSSVQEPTFLIAQNLLDKSVEVRENVEISKSSISPTNEQNIEKPEVCQNLEIDEDSTKESIGKNLRNEDFHEKLNLTRNIEKLDTEGSRDVKTLADDGNFEDHERSIKVQCNAANTEIEKESFPEVGSKRDSSNDDLNATVTAENSSTEDIPASLEPENYAEFVPQRQSTTLDPQQQFEPCKSPVVAAKSDAKSIIARPNSLKDDYSAFLPQKQSTAIDRFTSPISSKIDRKIPLSTTATLSSINNAESSKISPNKKSDSIEDRCNFAQLELAANSVANDIFNSSLELTEENEHFVSAESELFHDPTNFDFLLTKTPKKNPQRNLRDLSLYVKFDPLVSNTSMLPQGNIQNASPPANEARNGDNNTAVSNIGTPKPNPAIAAIDRLLFYSPMSTNTTPTNTNVTIQKTNDVQEKLKPTEETSEETINMAKELELVRTTVLQLEEQLEKLKIDHEEALETQASYKEKINQLQAQLAQEIKHKNEITVVVDEYEISISRLVAERERDRKNLDLEKAKLQEELAAAKHHLDNTEAAFNDVHLKYERLKAVVATYKSNEAALKESLQENVEIIKSLENRYEQVKSHATARLEKANQELEEIRKQNEAETVKLQAMLRKAELKSNSLAEVVEQKTKENKDLTQILDEVIARVGRSKSK